MAKSRSGESPDMGGCCGAFKRRAGNLSHVCGFNLLSFVLIVSLYSIISSTIEMCMMLSERKPPEQQEAEYTARQQGVSLFLFISAVITFCSGILGVLSTACRIAVFALVVFYVWLITGAMDIAEFSAILLTANKDKWHLFTTSIHLLFALLGAAGFFSYYRVLQRGGSGAEGKSADNLQRSFASGTKKMDEGSSARTSSTRASATYGTEDLERGNNNETEPYADTPLVG